MSWLTDTKREYLRISEVGEIFSLSRNTVISLIDDGVLEGIRINGKTLRVSIESVRRMRETSRIDDAA